MFLQSMIETLFPAKRQPTEKETNLQVNNRIAEMLKANPEKLAEFETAYKAAALTDETPSDNLFEINSRQASAMARTKAIPENIDETYVNDILHRATDELTSETQVIAVTNGMAKREDLPVLPAAKEPITNAELNCIPQSIRPQVTGNLMKIDTPNMSCKTLLPLYEKAVCTKDPKIAKQAYQQFRQGLDILDLDPITYQMLSKNQNSMGYWLPKITQAVAQHEFFKIPETRIAKVPMPILQLARIDYESLTPATLKIVDDWAMKAFQLDTSKTYFIKTGTFSSKFDFRNAKVKGEKEVRELGEYLLFIQHQACLMAGPLSQPTIYGVSTTNEWVVREYIEDAENNPCIYKGLPLHTEYRVFVDFDTKEILGINPYWDPDIMKKRFSQGDDANSPHQRHDYIIYKMHEQTLMDRYNKNKDLVLRHIEELLPDTNLSGQWSIDIMQNKDDFWLIDMATADTSALTKCIPQGKLKVTPENWIPAILDTTDK